MSTLECNNCGSRPIDWDLIRGTEKSGDQCPCCFLDDYDCDGILQEVTDNHLEVRFGLSNPNDSKAGYSLIILNGLSGRTILSTSKDPASGKPLLSVFDCLRVVGYYA